MTYASCRIYKSARDIDKDGVFAKDQELKDFLTSPQAICAALQLQHAFETQRNQQESGLEQGLCDFCCGRGSVKMRACASQSLLQMIENYVQWGGDHGLAEKRCERRAACSRGFTRGIARRAQMLIVLKDSEDYDVQKQWVTARTPGQPSVRSSVECLNLCSVLTGRTWSRRPYFQS